MPSSAYVREKSQQCEAVLAVLAEAGCPGVIPDGMDAIDAWVLLRPALRALWVPRLKYEWIEREVRDNPERYPWRLFIQPETHRRYLCVQLSPFLMLAGYQGTHPVCINHVRWHIEVVGAMMQHGWYDPATGHTPPAGEELNALERVEEGRDLFNTIMPGIGGMMTGHDPQTEEGRRNIWYIVVDDDGQETLINGMDMPTKSDDDEEDDYA